LRGDYDLFDDEEEAVRFIKSGAIGGRHHL
jgi:hypothetical protein